MHILFLIFAGVLLNATAQLLLKQGMNRIGQFEFTLQNILPIGYAVATNPFILAGLISYVVSVVIWLLALSRVDVSYAYPMLSVGYIITAIAAYFWLNEPLTLTRISGILVIILGVYLITRTA